MELKELNITLFGKEYKLVINFATLLAFEEITHGKDIFDPAVFEEGHVKFMLTLFYAMLLANNPEDTVPEFDAILHIGDPKAMSEIITKTTELHTHTMMKPVGEPGAKKEEDDPKNA